MLTVILTCIVVMALTTLIHYEVLGALNYRLPALRIPDRSKLLVVMLVTFVAHLVEMVVWGIALYLLVLYADVGGLRGSIDLTLISCIYFSAETYTSLGFGDVTPEGHMRHDRYGGPQRAAADRLVGLVHLPVDGAFLERAQGPRQALSRPWHGPQATARSAFTNSSGALTIGKWPVAISTTRQPGCARTRSRIASMVG